MTYEITEKDFLTIVEKEHCFGTETINGLATEGHSICNNCCKGNYFVGGECNYGGNHVLSKDLVRLNQNFKDFEILTKNQENVTDAKNEKEFERKKKRLLDSFELLKKKCKSEGQEFFAGTCISIKEDHKSVFQERIKSTFRRLARELEYYADKITKTTWEQLRKFQEKLDQLNNMQSEALQLSQEYKEAKDRGDDVEATRLFALLLDKNSQISAFQLELKKDSVFSLFNKEKGSELNDIVQNIFHGQGNFFQWDENEKQNEEETNEKYWGIIPKKWGKPLQYLGIGAIILLIIFFIYRKFFK